MSENKIVTLAEDEPLNLDGGGSLSKFKTAYTTYGKLNDKKNNSILEKVTQPTLKKLRFLYLEPV